MYEDTIVNIVITPFRNMHAISRIVGWSKDIYNPILEQLKESYRVWFSYAQLSLSIGQLHGVASE